LNAAAATTIETVLCGRCEAICDSGDNFCRRCGLVLHEQRLPSVRRSHLPVAWRPQVRAVVVRGVAVVAAGALAEMLARRLVRRTVGRVFGGRAASTKLARHEGDHSNGSTADDAQLVSDTVLMRHIRIRR
jgi:hypothetical protein